MKPKEVLQLFVDAFNQVDANAVSFLYAEDAINHQITNEPIHGRENIKKFKIVFQRGYWDKLSFLKQHGLPIE